MSPRTSFLLTLAGVLLVGLPLPLLTRKPENNSVATTVKQSGAREQVSAFINITGNPRKIKVRTSGGNWQELESCCNHCDFEQELQISEPIELEIQAEWDTDEAQALSLTLEPEGKEAMTKTLWKEEGCHHIHDIMTFSW